MPSGSTATTSFASPNPVAAMVSPQNGFPQGTFAAQPSSRVHAPSRIQDEDLEADADADADEDEDDEHIDGSEAHHNMINETTVKSGYLEKKGEKRKTWKKRWFVLRSSKLAYYKNEKEYQLLRFIDVGDIKTVASVELKKSVNTFGIVTPKRTFYVRASSRQDMESWVQVLNNVMTQYAQSSTMTQEMAALELANAETPAPSATLPQSQSHIPSSLQPSQQHKRSLSQERTPTSAATPIKIGIPGHGTFTAPAQPRPIPGSAAFSPLATTSDSETGAERYGLSYTSSTSQSMSGSPSTRTDPSQSFLLAGQSPGGGGGHTSGSELSDVGGGHQRRPSGGYGSLPRQRSISASRRMASYSSGAAADQPSSPGLPPTGGVGGNNQVLSSSDEEGEDEWDEEEIADQAMPLPALGTSQSSQSQPQPQQQASLGLPGLPQQQQTQLPQLSISSLPSAASDLIRDPNKVITQGYLMKQSGRRKVWRKRWFVLTSSRLLYSRSHMDSKAHRQIPIASMLDAIEYESKKASAVPTSPGIGSPSSNPFGLENGDTFSPPNVAPGAPDKPERRGSMVAAAAGVASNMTAGMVGSGKKRKDNCFQIITPKRTFVLCAPGEDEEIKWISALKTLIGRQRSGQSVPVTPSTPSAANLPFFAGVSPPARYAGAGGATSQPSGVGSMGAAAHVLAPNQEPTTQQRQASPAEHSTT